MLFSALGKDNSPVEQTVRQGCLSLSTRRRLRTAFSEFRILYIIVFKSMSKLLPTNLLQPPAQIAAAEAGCGWAAPGAT